MLDSDYLCTLYVMLRLLSYLIEALSFVLISIVHNLLKAFQFLTPEKEISTSHLSVGVFFKDPSPRTEGGHF